MTMLRERNARDARPAAHGEPTADDPVGAALYMGGG